MNFPLPPPHPPPDCAQCAAWARTRQRAQAAGDLSRVTDMNVLIRRHHPPTATGWNWHDGGSSPSRIQHTADDARSIATQTAYRAYIDHSASCPVCATESEVCADAQALWETYAAQAATRQ